MKLSPEEVKKIARLARLKLEESEVEKFSGQAGWIFGRCVLEMSDASTGVDGAFFVWADRGKFFECLHCAAATRGIDCPAAFALPALPAPGRLVRQHSPG